MEDEVRKGFTFFESYAKAIKRIKKKADRADVYDAICNYALYDIEPNLDSASDVVAVAFDLIKPTLDASKKKSMAGQIGGSKEKGTSKQTGSKSKAKPKQPERDIGYRIKDDGYRIEELEIENECSRKQAELAKEDAGPPAGEEQAEGKTGNPFGFSDEKCRGLIASFRRLNYPLSDWMVKWLADHPDEGKEETPDA